MKDFLSSSTNFAHTRYGWKVATPRRTPTATRTRNDACGAHFDNGVVDAAPRRLPRHQSRDGMAIRGSGGDAGAKGKRSSQVTRPYRNRPRGCSPKRRSHNRATVHSSPHMSETARTV